MTLTDDPDEAVAAILAGERPADVPPAPPSTLRYDARAPIRRGRGASAGRWARPRRLRTLVAFSLRPQACDEGFEERARVRDTAAAADMIGTDGIDPATVAEVERWAGELIVPPGDSAAEALAPGSPYRLALEEARAEIAAGRPSPTPEWRRRWALPLGLQRLLADDTPKLAGGLELRPHQVDALAGMLGALLGAIEREGEDAAGADENGDADEPVAEAVEVEEDEVEEITPRLRARRRRRARGGRGRGAGRRRPTRTTMTRTTTRPTRSRRPTPARPRRYRFKHPTASGKTVAAAGFVDAAKITGVLILTHRRLLVDQFERDLKSQGYGRRLEPAVLRGQRAPAHPAGDDRDVRLVHPQRRRASNRDVYGVVLCDEAHTALGDRTSAAIRRLDSPTYIGMTATDQLLQKHVGDVFPVEIDDFPLGDAVREGVVAPLRAVRVKPGASRQARAHRRRRLRPARAGRRPRPRRRSTWRPRCYYADMFGNRPGIVYAAGVDHAAAGRERDGAPSA